MRNTDVDPLMRRWPIPYSLSIGRVRCGDWASSMPDLLEADGRLGGVLYPLTIDLARTDLLSLSGWLA